MRRYCQQRSIMTVESGDEAQTSAWNLSGDLRQTQINIRISKISSIHLLDIGLATRQRGPYVTSLQLVASVMDDNNGLGGQALLSYWNYPWETKCNWSLGLVFYFLTNKNISFKSNLEYKWGEFPDGASWAPNILLCHANEKEASLGCSTWLISIISVPEGDFSSPIDLRLGEGRRKQAQRVKVW